MGDILFLCITFTGNTFNVYNDIRNTITNSKYEINKDAFYISKNILSLPIIIVIYFFLNNTELNYDFSEKDQKFTNFLKEYTDLLPNKPIPFLYLFVSVLYDSQYAPNRFPQVKQATGPNIIL